MSLRKILFKPRWRHKDVDIRAAAVTEGEEPELIQALPDIVLEDESALVRLAAARRVRDLDVLLRARRKATDPAEQGGLDARIASLTSSTGADRPPVDIRMKALENADRDLLENVAVHAPEKELRRAAVGRIQRQGLLGDIAINDADPETRRLAAERVTQHSTLQRVIQALRKSDKHLHHELLARLQDEKLSAGDPGAVELEALAICQGLEELLLGAGEKGLDALEQRWTGIDALATPVQKQRHEGLVTQIRNPAPAKLPDSEKEAEPEAIKAPETDATPVPETEVHDSPESESPPPKKVEGKPTRANEVSDDTAQRFSDIDERLAALETALDDGELANSVRLQGEILELGKPLRQHRQWKAVEARLRRRQGRLRELRDWQHWSNNKHREELIVEMHALQGSGLHPDAVLARIKELQKQWKDLERSEQIPGERHFAAPRGLWRKFQAVGQATFEQTKPFLDKRSEVYEKHLEEMQGVISDLESQSIAESPDWIALRRSVSRAGKAMRELDGVPAKHRRKMAGQLRAGLGKARARLSDHNDDIEKTKRKLIREATQLTHTEDRADAIARAKALQADWKRAGSLPRGREQKLWEQFREPIDPLFEALDTEREAERAEHQESLDAQKALLTQLKQLLETEDADLATLAGKLKGLDDAWGEFRRPDKKLREQFRRLSAEFDKRVQAQALARASEERDRWWRKADILQSLESALVGGKVSAAQLKKLTKDWPAVDSPGGLESDLDQRWAAALSAADSGSGLAPPGEDIAEQARMLCIRLEFLSGISSPVEDSELRMAYQVKRLSDSMAGGERRSTRQETIEAEREWLLMPAMTATERKRFATRIRTALDELQKV